MMGWVGTRLSPWFSLLAALAASFVATSVYAGDSRSSGPGKSLAAKASDPTEPLVQITTDNDLVVSNRDGDGLAHQF
jgi:hypothetical protein